MLNSSGKGVISEIRPDECMPVDQYGVRADVIMTPASTINRMNPSQFFEQFWNRLSTHVVATAKQQNMDWKATYKFFLGFCKDFRKAYAQALDTLLLDTQEKKKQWVQENLEQGYIRLLSAWTKGRDYGYLDAMAKKYGYEPTPVTYKAIDEQTGEIETITTEEPAVIGSKYFMYLGKIPDDAITAVEMSYVNQFEIPIKPKSKRIKEQSLVGITPQKFGEDEVCMLNMSLGDSDVARMMCLHSSAPNVSKMLAAKLLRADRPTQLVALDMTTHDVIDQNRNCLIFTDMMGAIGYDVRSTAAPTAGPKS